MKFRRKKRDLLGLTPVYEPPEPHKPAADLVLIHGLGGRSHRTWVAPTKGGVFWPETLLAKDALLQNQVAISSFGYSANWSAPEDSMLDVEDFARQLLDRLTSDSRVSTRTTGLILIGHSMGGLVAKSLYVIALAEQQRFTRRIHAIFFLGTPHKGAKLAPLLRQALKLTPFDKPFVCDLDPASPKLEKLQADFNERVDDLQIHSFFETQPLRIFGPIRTVIVPRDSAKTGCETEKLHGSNANHRQLCKFHDANDENYLLLRNMLVLTVKEIRAKCKSLAVSATIPHTADDPLLTC